MTRIFGTLSLGEFAVDSFFVLSGFLIVKSWQTKPDWIIFLKNRILRICPGFIAASLVCAFLIGPVAGNADYHSQLSIRDFLFGIVLLKPPVLPPVFENSYYPLINGSMWTITYEFRCYLIVMFFGLAGGFRYKLGWLVLTALASAAYLAGQFQISERLAFLDNNNLRFLMLFGLGGTYWEYFRNYSPRASLSLTALVVFVCLLFIQPLAHFASGLFWGFALLGFANSHSSRLDFFNSLPDVSYGVYLYAWPVTKLIILQQPDITVFKLTLITVLASLLLGILSWYIVERPFLKSKSILNTLRFNRTQTTKMNIQV